MGITMQGILIFLCCSVFMCAPYLVWPSRYNIPAHMSIGFVLLAYFIPAVVLSDQNDFPPNIVYLYTVILTVGATFYIAGIFAGFKAKSIKTNFSFEILAVSDYENRVARITKIFIICGIIGMVAGFGMMGFVPMFAADPLAAKFFRNQYQVSSITSIVYLSSFTILSTIVPISFMVWYINKKKVFFLLATLVAVFLLSISLARGSAFTGMVYSGLLIMAFKGRKQFAVAIILLISIYALSSIFYFIIGVRDISSVSENFKSDHLYWRILSSGTIDLSDQLVFLQYFEANPLWTFGRTVYGGLVPGHYQWNPSVYTLRVIYPNEDVTTLISGGLRLPVPIWGYVSFQWPGVIIFCFISGFIKGVFVKYLKKWILTYPSTLIATVVVFISINLFEQFSNFYALTIYTLPPALILLFYLYRIKLK